MNKTISGLEELTQHMMSQLNRASYEELSNFVDQRQVLVDEIRLMAAESPLTAEELERLRNVLSHDAVILGRMQMLKSEAGDWLQQRGQAKIQRNVYEAAYSPDSILMDKRK
ncbi:flagellar protein FliT [Paenibacillus nasutitermitis]|uniref:Flagellar protein FliT n=1 Tax=Paenibacillus nasutitermitis TaxID=1652958 RepID=A0A916ZE82_9BACL|nr:flagellar protein FliT [Paenibacillus nasutitermitis]GGD92181.1 hypothetical protein GCM10010911_58530 [Paenibacillus nasutitermitis]